ncbi:MAG: ParA family protein [Gammaproteobacteria bacterium]|nr:ParA family protein [Gammaproteobacteria bacterium]
MKILAVMNQKGGVGKTTTTLNFSHALSQNDRKILLIDADPQGHLGNCYGIADNISSGLDEVLLSGDAISHHLKPVRENVDILPAGIRLGEMETKSQTGANRGYRLHDALALEKNQTDYDYVIIDCPPASGLLAMNALLAADEILIPVTGDYLALQGLSRLIKVVRNIEKRLQRQTKKHFVLTRFYERRRLANQIKQKIIQHFPNQVLKSVIRENVSLAESPGFGKSIFEYRPKSHGAEDYSNLAKDYLEGNYY